MTEKYRAYQADPILQLSQKAPVFSADEEHELAVRWRVRGDRRASEQLARAQLRNVVSIARSFRRYGFPLGDLVAEGNFGVVHALSKFDPERGVRFATYSSYWVRAAILAHIVRFWSVYSGGSGALRTRMFFKLRRERARAQAQYGDCEAADLALAKALSVSSDQLRAMFSQIDARGESLDLPLSEARSLASNQSVNQEELAYLAQMQPGLRTTVKAALSQLDTRELYIAERCLMAEPEDELSLADVGRNLGICRERARQLKARTIKKLRQHVRADENGNDWETLAQAV